MKEHDVIGQSVFKLFMSRREAAASRRDNRVFFRSGNAYEVELWIPTCKGQRLFLFRNKFVHSGSGKNEIFLICSGTDITEERRARSDCVFWRIPTVSPDCRIVTQCRI
ncbi:hypothetical protein ACVXG9_05395 [Escherichia coli]